MSTTTATRDGTARAIARATTGLSSLRLAGSMLFLAGAAIMLGITTAEALYPVPYSTGGNTISDLGGTELPEGLVYQPSAAIFDGAMIVVGLMVIAASILIHRALGRRSVTIPILVLGVGALGVGVFPGNTGTPHALFSMTIFISGGVAALFASRVTGAPFRYVSILLGAVSLLVLGSYVLLGDSAPYAALGIGGVERWIVYPIVVFITAFGGYLAGGQDT